MAKKKTQAKEAAPQKITAARHLKLSLLSGVLFACIIAVMLLFAGKARQTKHTQTTPPVAVAQQQAKDTVSYKGQASKDALTLLKQNATVEQDSSGLVVSINGRKADNSKHEFWAFFVNGKEAMVGPADYQSKDGDQIEWKIEHY